MRALKTNTETTKAGKIPKIFESNNISEQTSGTLKGSEGIDGKPKVFGLAKALLKYSKDEGERKRLEGIS